MWWLIAGGFGAWLLMHWWLDGPSIPAWEARNNFKVMNALLVFLLVLMAIKASAWRAELVALIPYCR